jgi:hypothetical protein
VPAALLVADLRSSDAAAAAAARAGAGDAGCRLSGSETWCMCPLVATAAAAKAAAVELSIEGARGFFGGSAGTLLLLPLAALVVLLADALVLLVPLGVPALDVAGAAVDVRDDVVVLATSDSLRALVYVRVVAGDDATRAIPLTTPPVGTSDSDVARRRGEGERRRAVSLTCAAAVVGVSAAAAGGGAL